MGSILPLFLVVVQFAFLPMLLVGGDISKTVTWLCCGLGFGFTIYLAIRNRLQAEHGMLLVVPAYMAVRACATWVPGYTGLEWAKIAGTFCVAILACCSDRKWLWRSIMAVALIQIAVTWCHLVPWEAKFTGVRAKAYSFGTMRHTARYATIVLAGMLAAWQVFHYEKEWRNRPWRIMACITLAAGAVALYQAQTHTMLWLAVAAFAWLLWRRGVQPVGVLVIVLHAVLLLALLEGRGMICISRRGLFWSTAWTGWLESPTIVAYGHGIGAWHLQALLPNGTTAGHPHCSLLAILYEQGAAGAACWIAVLAWALLYARHEPVLPVALAAVTLATLTNSMGQYIEIRLVWSVFLGMAASYAVEDRHHREVLGFGDEGVAQYAGY